MTERVWDRFLTEQDKQHLARSPIHGRRRRKSEMPTLDYGRPKRQNVRVIVFVTVVAVAISTVVALSAFVRYMEMKPWPVRSVPYSAPTITPASTGPSAN